MSELQPPRRIVITAGPTHEPMDAVRYIANRSSGRLGLALAHNAVQRGWTTTLLLGPICQSPNYTQATVERFTTTADLQRLITTHAPACDILIMAAAVADFRPIAPSEQKMKRGAGAVTLTLEPTPDLLADVAAHRRPGQTLIGFALEFRDRLTASAIEKLKRKKVDAIVANPMETMGSDEITATMFWSDGAIEPAPAAMSKEAFASWLLDRAARHNDQGR